MNKGHRTHPLEQYLQESRLVFPSLLMDRAGLHVG